MTWRHYLVLILSSCLVILIIGKYQSVPGYMDAEYYFLGGTQLAEGRGFTMPVVWNFLDGNTDLPGPSHAYWMPLTSILAAIGMKLIGLTNFVGARLGFVILATAIPPLTALLSYRIYPNQWSAILAGFLAIASGFYLPYIITTDTFSLYMLFGLMLFLLLPKLSYDSSLIFFGLGSVVGFMHLSRADGLFWLPLILIFVWLSFRKRNTLIQLSKPVLFVILGYLLIMGPWMCRNFIVFRTPLSPGGLKMLWLTDYDQLFTFPSDQLSFRTWWSSGFLAILRARLWALGINLQRVVAEQGLIFLLPLIVSGLWSNRRDLRVKIGFWGWCLTFLVMTLIFPFAGARGGLFHSMAAVQPLFWAVVPKGLENFLAWGTNRRGWKYLTARNFFSSGIVLLAISLSVVVFYQRVIGPDSNSSKWDKQFIHYQEVEEALVRMGALSDDLVMVKNPPGYYVATQRYAVVIPNGGIDTLLAVAGLYDARYLVLERDHVQGLDEIYRLSNTDTDRIIYKTTVGDTHIFEIK